MIIVEQEEGAVRIKFRKDDKAKRVSFQERFKDNGPVYAVGQTTDDVDFYIKETGPI